MSECTIMCLDPGEHTGWCCVRTEDMDKGVWHIRGGTADKDHRCVVELLEIYYPDIVVFERFNLYPGMAKTLSWNSFYPCEVIGVIRWWCMQHNVTIYEQAPSIKKFSGGLQNDWKLLKDNSVNLSTQGVTEHTKDAYLHWKYFERNTLSKAINAEKAKRYEIYVQGGSAAYRHRHG